MATDVIASSRDCVRSHIHPVQGRPNPAVMYRDITPLLAGPGSFRMPVDDRIDPGDTMMAGRTPLERLGVEFVAGAAILPLPELGRSVKLTASGLARVALVDFAGT